MKRIMMHYRIPTIIAIFMVVLLSSCSSDDESNSGVPVSISQTIQAEWYSPDAERYMNFEYMYVTGTVYQNMSTFPETVETFSGQWFYSRGGVLAMNVLYDNSLKGGAEDYYVLQCDDRTLKLRHTTLGLMLNFYKIVESYKARIGDRFDIEYTKNHTDFSSATYTTSNSDIADVDSNGRVIVRGGGLAFITVSSTAGSVVVRVDGGQRVNSYTAEISETIDQVIARNGEPDRIVTTKTGTYAALYETPENIIDSTVGLIGYVYDADTREVTCVEIHYKKDADKWFLSDEEYLSREFYLFLNQPNHYVPNPSLLDNHFYIRVVKKEKENGLIIYNFDYITEHGYY